MRIYFAISFLCSFTVMQAQGDLISGLLSDILSGALGGLNSTVNDALNQIRDGIGQVQNKASGATSQASSEVNEAATNFVNSLINEMSSLTGRKASDLGLGCPSVADAEANMTRQITSAISDCSTSAISGVLGDLEDILSLGIGLVNDIQKVVLDATGQCSNVLTLLGCVLGFVAELPTKVTELTSKVTDVLGQVLNLKRDDIVDSCKKKGLSAVLTGSCNVAKNLGTCVNSFSE